MNTQVLERPTLVLNRRWAAIRTASVREAICLVAKGSARIIDPETYETHDLATWSDASRAKAALEGAVRSPSVSLAAPDVIVLTLYEGRGEGGVVFSRRTLFARDRHTCQYCGGQPGAAEMTIDHVVPRSRGGLSTWENCVLACVACNSAKGGRTPAEAGLRLRRAPRRPSSPILPGRAVRRAYRAWEKFLADVYWDAKLES